METVVIKDIEDDMGGLAAGETLPIGAVTEQVEPVSNSSRLDRRESNLAIGGRKEFTIWTFTIWTFI
jgi:hypothetical protein